MRIMVSKKIILSDQRIAEIVIQTREKALGEPLSGKFYRFPVEDMLDGKQFIVLYFSTEQEVALMTYQEALELPALGEACKERWG